MDHAEAMNGSIETERLTLEPLTEMHADAAWPGLSSPALYEFIPQHPPASVELLANQFRRQSARRSPDGQEIWLNWMARERSTGALTATFQATVRSNAAWVAYLVFRDRWGEGFAGEGIAAVTSRLFQFDVERIHAEIDERNERSIRVVERCGFRLIKRVAGADFFKGASSNEVHFALDRHRP